MNLLPLCTASVWPTNSGSTVQRRAQVLSTRLSPLRFIVSIFFTRDSTTNGPFFTERAMSRSLPLLRPSPHDQAIAQLAPPCLETLGDLSPRRARVPAARRLPFSAAHRMVDRIHRHAAHRWVTTHPAAAAGLADRHVLVVEVADLTHHRAAVDVEAPHLARRQSQLRVVAFLRHQLAIGAGRARHPRGAPREQLDVVEVGAERNVLERKTIADLDLRVRSGLELLADAQAIGRQNVAPLAVDVVQQRDPRRAVRVVLDAGHARGDAVLVAAEVHEAIAALVAAADPARGHG